MIRFLVTYLIEQKLTRFIELRGEVVNLLSFVRACYLLAILKLTIHFLLSGRKMLPTLLSGKTNDQVTFFYIG